MGRFLCWVGFHRWEYLWLTDMPGDSGDAVQCTRCGKIEELHW